jgi:hypothetical protein
MANPDSEEKSASGWEGAYREIERSRREQSKPDPSKFKNLMKAVGGRK